MSFIAGAKKLDDNKPSAVVPNIHPEVRRNRVTSWRKLRLKLYDVYISGKNTLHLGGAAKKQSGLKI
jgi:hypothetical protein